MFKDGELVETSRPMTFRSADGLTVTVPSGTVGQIVDKMEARGSVCVEILGTAPVAMVRVWVTRTSLRKAIVSPLNAP